MDDPPLSAISARHWMVVIGSGLLMGLNVLAFLAIGLLLPPMADTLGVGLGQVMVFVSINTTSGALAMVVAGPYLMRRLGNRRLALLGGCVVGTLLFLVSVVGNLWQLYTVAFAAGLLATISMQMTGAALVNDWFVRRRGLMLGLLMGIASLGGVAAGAVLPVVVQAGGWQAGFRFVGVVTVTGALFACGVLIRSTPAEVGLHVYGAHDAEEEAHKDEGGVAAHAAVRTPQFAALVVGLVSWSAIMALQQHIPSIMGERGLDLAAAGTLLSLLSVVNVVMTLVLGNLTDRLGPVVSVAVAGVLLVATLCLILLTTGYPAQVAAMVLFGIPAVASPILTPILLRRTFGGRAFVPLLGVATATMPIGIALGSPLWGLSMDATGSFDTALVVAAALTVVNVALIVYALVTGPRLWRGVASVQEVGGQHA